VSGGLGMFSAQEATVFVATAEPEGYTASVVNGEEVSRDERIASLRKKIIALGNLGVAAQQEVIPDSPVPTADETTTGPVVEKRCGDYTAGGVGWNSAGVLLEEVEGARLVYRETKSVAMASTSSSSSSSATIIREILAQLPIRSIPAVSQSCVASDVVGISKNGALIRNTQVAGYGSFGGDILVGYALDGFPIYGATEKRTDICGGLMEDGQYRYQISNTRDTIITCYAGTPITL
jgi:hypothetical protein